MFVFVILSCCLVGARWKLLSDSDKAPYAKKAVVDKSRYEKEMAKFAVTQKK